MLYLVGLLAIGSLGLYLLWPRRGEAGFTEGPIIRGHQPHSGGLPTIPRGSFGPPPRPPKGGTAAVYPFPRQRRDRRVESPSEVDHEPT